VNNETHLELKHNRLNVAFNYTPYLFDFKPQLAKFIFHYFMRLVIKGGLRSRAAYIFLFLFLIERYR